MNKNDKIIIMLHFNTDAQLLKMFKVQYFGIRRATVVP
jgi:hypothetical protein